MIPTSITLDRFGMAVWKSQFAVGILGNVENGDYELVEINTVPLIEDELRNFRQRNLAFLGVIAYHEGEACPRTAFEYHDWDAQTIAALSRKFLNMLERELNARVAKRVGDSLDWLQRLMTMPDLRNKEMN